MTPQIPKRHFTLIPHLILHVLMLLLQARWGHSHPQCLDYKPPFQPQQPLVFCKDYSKFGCCDLQKDEEIRIRFYTIMENFDHSGYVTCNKYIRGILCQVGKTVHHFYQISGHVVLFWDIQQTVCELENAVRVLIVYMFKPRVRKRLF